VDQLREQEVLEKENERLRTNVATLYGRVASLEQAVAEAPGTRAAAPSPGPAVPELPGGERTWVPVLAEEFLEILQKYREDDVQRIVQAMFLACLNPSRPSLNFKKLAGAGELWSVRAGPSLRLYFRREGRRLRFVALADREEQDEVIRSLRERFA